MSLMKSETVLRAASHALLYMVDDLIALIPENQRGRFTERAERYLDSVNAHSPGDEITLRNVNDMRPRA